MKTNQKIAKLGLLSAASFLLMLIEIPLIPSFTFLKFDPSDVIPLMTGLYSGAGSCFLILVIRNLCHVLLKPSPYPLFGEFMSLLASLSFVLPTVIIYGKIHTKPGAAIGIILSIGSLTAVMYLANLTLAPLVLGFLKDPVVLNHYLCSAVIPFNLAKGVINGLLTYFSYKKFSAVFLAGLR
ncbi:MAG: ECF transporter S component [Candidatus Wallbacteria bacterium]|nr:ECF transporter S component [Candidatus Wallbacteria bacterium]